MVSWWLEVLKGRPVEGLGPSLDDISSNPAHQSLQ